MAYFSNGAEGMDYRARYCDNCVHDVKCDCPIWNLHLTHNYEECNKQGSFLDALIPRSKDRLSNEQCKLFLQKP